MKKKAALLLIGSPKAQGSTSASLGGYLLEQLRQRDIVPVIHHVGRLLRAADGMERLRREMDSAAVVIISTPLYIDSLPAPLIAAMEMLAQERQGSVEVRTGLLAILNSGFPEAQQNDTALAICRIFARQAGFRWLGGLALGGGGAISGRPLDQVGGMARSVRRALDLAAESIATGREIPAEAARLMAKPMMPSWLYNFVGEMGWRRQARQNGVRRQLGARPYEKAENPGGNHE